MTVKCQPVEGSEVLKNTTATHQLRWALQGFEVQL
jgi:hypothetical protein